MTDKEDKKEKDAADNADEVTIEPELGLEHGGKDPVEKIKKLKEELKAALALKADYLSGWQRAKADLVNFKRETEQTKGEFIRFAKEEIIHDFLPVLDSFDRAKSHTQSWDMLPEDWKIGFQGIYTLLKNALENHGVKEVNPVGEKYDHTSHEAATTVSTEDKNNDGVVLEVLEKGYSLNDKIIRPPKVVVGEYKNH